MAPVTAVLAAAGEGDATQPNQKLPQFTSAFTSINTVESSESRFSTQTDLPMDKATSHTEEIAEHMILDDGTMPVQYEHTFNSEVEIFDGKMANSESNSNGEYREYDLEMEFEDDDDDDDVFQLLHKKEQVSDLWIQDFFPILNHSIYIRFTYKQKKIGSDLEKNPGSTFIFILLSRVFISFLLLLHKFDSRIE